MGNLVLRIEPDGAVVGLSGSGIEEALDLRAFGPMTVERAGSIFFDEAGQSWGWRRACDRMGGLGFETRRAAVADEIRVLVGEL